MFQMLNSLIISKNWGTHIFVVMASLNNSKYRYSVRENIWWTMLVLCLRSSCSPGLSHTRLTCPSPSPAYLPMVLDTSASGLLVRLPANIMTIVDRCYILSFLPVLITFLAGQRRSIHICKHMGKAVKLFCVILQ